MKFKYVTTLVLSFMFLACGSYNFEINSSSKRIKHSGISSGKSSVEYTIEFNSGKEFLIDDLKLNDQESFEFSLFSSTLKNYVKPKENNPKGSYILTFKTFNVKEIDKEDFVMLFLKVDKKTEKQKIPVIKKKAFRSR